MTEDTRRDPEALLAASPGQQTGFGDGLAESIGLGKKWTWWKLSHEERGCGDLASCLCDCPDHGCKDLTDPPYNCDGCHDKGFVQEIRRSLQFGTASYHYAAKPCDQCNVPEALRLRYHQLCSAIPFEWFDLYRLDRLPVQRLPRSTAEVWWRSQSREDRIPTLVISGQRGTGKTHTAIGIAGEFIKTDRSVFYVTAPDLLDAIKATFGSKEEREEDYTRPAKAVDLFILDDLGTELQSDWAAKIIFGIINYRYMHRLSTIITTNKDPDAPELGDERLRSRITGQRVATIIRIPTSTPDYRNVPTEES